MLSGHWRSCSKKVHSDIFDIGLRLHHLACFNTIYVHTFISVLTCITTPVSLSLFLFSLPLTYSPYSALNLAQAILFIHLFFVFYRMDSFVLAETFKYLYLLFSEEEETILDMDEFVFTTEAHILPLSLRNQEMGKRASSKESNNTHAGSRRGSLSPTCPRHNVAAETQKESYRRVLLNQCSVLRFSFT